MLAQVAQTINFHLIVLLRTIAVNGFTKEIGSRHRWLRQREPD
jgi:hypothetical protein